MSRVELDLDAIEAHAAKVKAFVNDDGDQLPEDCDGLLTVLGATEVMADDLADTALRLIAEVRRLRTIEAAARRYKLVHDSADALAEKAETENDDAAVEAEEEQSDEARAALFNAIEVEP